MKHCVLATSLTHINHTKKSRSFLSKFSAASNLNGALTNAIPIYLRSTNLSNKDGSKKFKAPSIFFNDKINPEFISKFDFNLFEKI